ncbi:hypothetical protein D3C75_538660 [compost metagenome]
MDCLFFCLFSHENNPPRNQECHFDYYCITNVEAIPIVFTDPMFEQLIFCGFSQIYSFLFIYFPRGLAVGQALMQQKNSPFL